MYTYVHKILYQTGFYVYTAHTVELVDIGTVRKIRENPPTNTVGTVLIYCTVIWESIALRKTSGRYIGLDK